MEKNNKKTIKKLKGFKKKYIIYIINMPLYKCELCNFSTKLKGNYKGHLNTFKHQRNFKIFETNDTIIKKGSTNEQKGSTKVAQIPKKGSTKVAQKSTKVAQMSTKEQKRQKR